MALLHNIDTYIEVRINITTKVIADWLNKNPEFMKYKHKHHL